MKKTALITSLIISFNIFAQFVAEKAPTETELTINNSNQVGDLLKIAYNTKTKKDYKNLIVTLKKLVALKPNTPVFKYQLAEAFALNDNKTEAFNELIAIQKQGFYFDIGNNTNFANISTFPVFKYIKENMEANNQHFGMGEKVFKIDKSFSGLLFESLVVDLKGPAFLMGSLRDGRIIKINDKGDITTLVEQTKGGKSGPWATTDMAIDSKNDVLWVASSAVSQYGKLTKESSGRSGVFKYQLSSGILLKSYLIPENKAPSLLMSIVLTAKGDVYFVDAVKNVVLRIEEDTDQISLAFTTKKYKSLRNITTDETGEILYLTDEDEGIIILNLKNQEVYTLPNSEQLNLTGISDIIYDDNGLIIIQNEMKPERIMRLALNKLKFVIENVFPIDAANPLFDTLSKGAVFDEDLFFIGNSQSANANLFGGLLGGKNWQDMNVMITPKHYNEKETLDYNKKINAQKRKTGSK